MDLQHQPVVEAHPRHLGQHLAAEGVGSLVGGAWPRTRGEERRGLGVAAGSRCGRVGGRGRTLVAPNALKKARRCAVRVEVAVPGAGVAAGDLAEAVDVGGEARELGIDHRVGAVGGDDPAVPAAVADHLVPAQVVERAVGGGDHLDVEALEERARPELGAGEAVGDLVVDGVGGRGRERLVEAEDVSKVWSSQSRDGVPRNRW